MNIGAQFPQQNLYEYLISLPENSEPDLHEMASGFYYRSWNFRMLASLPMLLCLLGSIFTFTIFGAGVSSKSYAGAASRNPFQDRIDIKGNTWVLVFWTLALITAIWICLATVAMFFSRLLRVRT